MTLRKLILVITICSFTVTPVAAVAAAKACALPGEKAALDIKALQSHLMVAALSCSDSERYNWFIKKFGSTIAAGSDDLHGYFERAYGSSAETRLNQFVTSVANRASKQSITMPLEVFCSGVNAMFSELANAGAGDLASLRSSAELGKLHGVRSCTANEMEMIKTARNQSK